MKNILAVASICLALLVVPTDTLAKKSKKMRVIDCDASFDDQKHLQKAVNKARKGAVVKVKGTCHDIALVIASPGITLQGEGSALTTLEGNGVDPVIRVAGADRATIEGLQLNSGSTGLSVDSARVQANDVTVTSNVTGFLTTAGAALNCNGCSADGNTGFGAIVFNSIALCGNNSFSGNGRSGVFVSLTSVLNLKK